MYTNIKHDYYIFNNWTNEQACTYFLEQMNSLMLGRCTEKYVFADKDSFFFDINIARAFDEMQDRGNKVLQVIHSTCSSCEHKHYIFVGDYDQSYFDLVFIVENKNVIEIFECKNSICTTPIQLDLEKRIWIDVKQY